MTLYIPASFCDEDYRPSWTGNNSYPTATIRGIFSTEEKAKEAIKGWDCEDDCEILERWFEEFNEYGEKILDDSFDIDYDDGYLYIWSAKHGYYELDKVVDEPYSAVYDENGDLGVTDW